MMFVKGFLTIKDYEVVSTNLKEEIITCGKVLINQDLSNYAVPTFKSDQFYLLILGAKDGSVPSDMSSNYGIEPMKTWLIHEKNGSAERPNNQFFLLFQLKTCADTESLAALLQDQCQLISEAPVNTNQSPLFIILIQTVCFEAASSTPSNKNKIFCTKNSYSSNQQRIPSCAVCIRRLRRFQPYSTYCVARSFSITLTSSSTSSSTDIQSTCKVCAIYATAQSSHGANGLLHCAACHLQQNLWVCLTCAYIGCGRYSQQHAQQHAQHAEDIGGVSSENDTSISLENHSWAFELATGRIWDYSLDDYAHYENDHQLLIQPSPFFTSTSSVEDATSFSSSPFPANSSSSETTTYPSLPQQYRAFSFAEAYAKLSHGIPPALLQKNSTINDGSKVLLVSRDSIFRGFSSPPATTSAAAAASTTSTGAIAASLSVTTMKLDRIATEYERLMEQQLQEQQLHYDKVIARETVRALQAQCVAATHHHHHSQNNANTQSTHPQKSEKIIKKGNATVNRFSRKDGVMAATDCIEEEFLDAEAVDDILKEIERLKIDVSAAEAEQSGLLSMFKLQDEATRSAKQRCDQLLRRQRQLQQLEETFHQREKETRSRGEAEIDELQQQVRDLSFYLDTQSNKEINGGDVMVASNNSNSANNHNNSKNQQQRGGSGKRK